MPLFAFTKPPKEDRNDTKPDENKQPSFEPKRVIHPSKTLSQSGDINRKPASIFRRNRASAPETKSDLENTKPEGFPIRNNQAEPIHTDKHINPGLRLRALVNAGKKSPPIKPRGEGNLFIGRERARRGYWNIAAGFSMIVNAILVAILLIMATEITNLKTTVNGLLSGLYGNLGEMDKASITTTITVDTQVPLNFMLPIQQNTNVILTDSVAIPNAHVVINSGGFIVNASANITLPAGTNLPVALDFAVPVQVSIPVTLQVPVNIPLAQTGLHQPFTGLQEIVRAYYCTLDKNAQYPQGIYICEDHDVPTSTPGVQ